MSAPRSRPPPPSEPARASEGATVVDLLRTRAALAPDAPAYTFLLDGETGEDTCTWAELDRAARVLGARLQALGATGQRVILLCPSGLDYVRGLFACFYAGAVAVPACPPRGRNTLPRLLAIVSDARPAFAIAPATLRARVEQLFLETGQATPFSWIAPEERGDSPASWREPPSDPDALALLQYTSGSTGDPRGVRLTHGNLIHNQRMIQHAFGTPEHPVVFGWLPLYHDMGLIGNLLHPLYLGARCVFMDPVRFVQRPQRWLEGIARFRATTSGGPNFAFDLSVEAFPAGPPRELDLSAWSVAFNGSEPVHAATLARFARHFAAAGFRFDAFRPCFGLAEATLIVSGGAPGAPRAFQREALAQGRIIESAPTQPGARTLIASGRALPGEQVCFVDPQTRALSPPDAVGEIWVRGPSVSAGYWNREDDTRETFKARLAGGSDDTFLRTGDLGFSLDGEIFIAGRLKDLIILHGKNLHPSDIEETASACHPALCRGSAAFDAEPDEGGGLVIVQEARSHASGDLRAAAFAIRRRVAEVHEIPVRAVLLVRPGAIPTTTSGKVRRRLCRETYLAGSFDALHAWRASDPEMGLGDSPPRTSMEELLSVIWAEVLGRDSVGVRQSFFDLGGDSVHALRIVARLQGVSHVQLSTTDLFEHPTIAELAAKISEPAAGEVAPTAPIASGGTAQSGPLAFGQEAMWLLERIAPGTGLYVVTVAARLEGPVDANVLDAALQALVARHAALRAAFPERGGQAVQVIAEEAYSPLNTVDLTGRGPDAEAACSALFDAEARRPFDLSRGPLFRVTLAALSAGIYRLQLALHHIICDHEALRVLLRDLSALYRALARGEAPHLPAPAFGPVDFARWQREVWAGARSVRASAATLPPSPIFPADRARPRTRTFVGASQSAVLRPSVSDALRAAARAARATPAIAGLASFAVFVHRYTGSPRFTVACPFSNRGRPELQDLVGVLVSTLSLAIDVTGDPTFFDLIERVRDVVLAAHRHSQDAPPDRDIPSHDSSRVMFSFLRHTGDELSLPAVRTTLLPHVTRYSMADLCLSMMETDGEIWCDLEGSTELYDVTTLRILHAKYLLSLAGVTAHPERPLSACDLTLPEEKSFSSLPSLEIRL
jgi:acyl-CoA synthetase (AMP-forming)/AMP-acid ligase II